jgi:hypothetical protein
LVVLGGLLVPAAAVLLVIGLERRGVVPRVDENDSSVVCGLSRLLSDDDKRAIERRRKDLRRLVSYREVGQ